MLRILQIISRKHCDTGGGLQALELARWLQKLGHQVYFCAKPGGSAQRLCEEMGLPFFPLSMRGDLDLESVMRLRGFLRRERIRVIHAHKGRAHGLALMATLGMNPRPLLVANRGVTFPLSFWNKWKYIFPQTTGVVAVSESVKGVLESSGVSPRKIRVIYGGVDLERFAPMDREEACCVLGLDSSLDYVVMVAHFRPWKGHGVLAEAVALLSKGHPRLRVLLAGKARGKAYKAFRSELQRLGLEEYFLFLGYRRDVELVMAASHFLVGPSLDGEGLPGVFREAMACARPVVASHVAGAPEVVIHEETGLLVPPGDASALARAMIRLLEDGDLRRAMGERGRRLMEERFSHLARAKAMEEYYIELMEGR